MADHSTHQEGENNSGGELKSKTAFRSSFLFVLILVGLFIAALNFINVMGHEEGHENHEATSGQTQKDESGSVRHTEESKHAESAPAAHDTIHRENSNH